MPKNSILKTLAKLLAFFVLAAYLVFALVKFNRPEKSLECTGLDITITGEPCPEFINEDEVRDLLVSKQLFPEGKALDDIDLTQLEQTLITSPYVAEALCFKTAEGRVAIRVTPRVPVLHVLNAEGQDFYIDNCGGTMPRGHHTMDLPVMTGNVPRATAGPRYSYMGSYLLQNSFWNKEIQEIHVHANGDIELTPRTGNFTILLGDTSLLADKLDRMRIFYTEGLDKAGWNRYKVISLKFEGQVIGVK